MSKLILSLLVFVAVAPPPSTIPPPGPNDPALCGPYGNGNKNYGSCNMVTTDKSFVACNQTTNRCYCLDTFSGNASPNNPCDCVSPNTVFVQADILAGGWGNLDSFGLGTPHCINLPPLLALDAAETRNQKHIASAMTFLLNTIGDKPTQILATGGLQLSSILSPNVRSRISPAGEFDGFEGVVEYFYGFVANPSFRVINVDFRSIAATGNTVGAKANIYLNNSRFLDSGNHPPQLWNLTTFAFFTFDNNDLISSIDVSVPNLGAILDIPDGFPNAAQIKFGLIQQVCGLMLTPMAPPQVPVALPYGFCGGFGIWGDVTGTTAQQKILTCINFMNNSIPYGTRYRNNANSFACRSLHAALIPFRPDPHCFHAGPDGGVARGSPACIDIPYSDYYRKDY